MKRFLLLLCAIFSWNFSIHAQNVGIGTSTPQGKLEIFDDSSGVIIPRVALLNTTDVATVPAPTVSELVYNTNSISDVIPGFYYWNGSSWSRLSDAIPAEDVDWYESAVTTVPDAITDNIYTQGYVGIGVTTPAQQLHVDGNIQVDGDTIMSVDNVATQFTMLSNGGIVMKLDNNDDGTGEEFSIKRGGPDLNSKVFTVTEAGNTTADGFGEFGGHGQFNGDLTILGNSRDMAVFDNFDILTTGNFDIFLDTNADNTGSEFAIKDDGGDYMMAIAEDTDLTLYGTDNTTAAGLRLREPSDNGSSWVALVAPPAISANRTFVLPNVYGSNGDVLSTDGAGNLSWATIGIGVETITAGVGVTNSGTAADPIIDVTTDNLTIDANGSGGTLQVIGLPPNDADYIWNQDAVAQSGARYRIQGDGTVSDFNITGGDIYGPGINYGSNGDARLHSNIDIELILDDDANGSEALMIYKNGTINDQNRVYIFEEGGRFRMKESGNAASPFYFGLRAPNLSADVDLTLPLTDGDAGEYLQTDGTGILSWSDGSELEDHDWYEVGTTEQPDDIGDHIFTEGTVGIGTTTPDYDLDVDGNIGLNEYLYHNDDDNTFIRYEADRIRLTAGGVEYIDMENASNEITINEDGAAIDLRVEGDTQDTLLLVDASQDRVGIKTGNPQYDLDVRGFANAYNQISTIPLWQGSLYNMNNTSGQDLSNCQSAIQPDLYAPGGNIEVKLVVRIPSPTAGTTNFQLRAHDGITSLPGGDFPITNAAADWTYASTQNGEVAISDWKDWNAGTNAFEIHLFGWVSGGTTGFNSAYLLVRPQQP